MKRFVLERGRLEPVDEEARAALASRQGEFFLAPTAPDMFWLVRSVPTGGKAPKPRVVLSADASAFPISDLIAFLSQARWSGTIRVHSSSGQRSIFLKDGEVRGANSDSPADRLGEVMLRMGYLTRAQLDEILREHPPSKLGRALVEKGVLQAHDVWKCITHQVSEIFHAIILSRDGVLLLLVGEPEDKSVQNVQLSMQSLLMDSIRKVDEMAHFRKRIPHARMYVAQKRPSDGKLEGDEDRVLALCNGQRTVLEIGAYARLAEFDVTKIIYRLLEGGYAQLSDHPVVLAPGSDRAAVTPGGALPAVSSRTRPTRDPLTVIRTFNKIFQEIRSEVASRGRDRELIAAANAALSGKALSQSPAMLGILFDRIGSLPETKLLDQFERVKGQLGSEPVASLRQALSDVMFFLLFQAGELLESRQDELLAKKVKDILAFLDEG
jgi:hypothetical protein